MMHNVVSFFMHLEFIPHYQTLYCCKVLKHLRGNIRGNDLWMNCSATTVAHSALKRSPLNICPAGTAIAYPSRAGSQGKWQIIMIITILLIIIIVDVSMWCRGWSEWSVMERKSLNSLQFAANHRGRRPAAAGRIKVYKSTITLLHTVNTSFLPHLWTSVLVCLLVMRTPRYS